MNLTVKNIEVDIDEDIFIPLSRIKKFKKEQLLKSLEKRYFHILEEI